jgi:hypothetical protein
MADHGPDLNMLSEIPFVPLSIDSRRHRLHPADHFLVFLTNGLVSQSAMWRIDALVEAIWRIKV